MRLQILFIALVTTKSSPYVKSEDTNNYFSIGRAITGMLSSGMNNFNNGHRTNYETNIDKDEEWGKDQHDGNISSDDLFNELDDIWSTKSNNKKQINIKKEPEETKSTERPVVEIPTVSKNVHEPELNQQSYVDSQMQVQLNNYLFTNQSYEGGKTEDVEDEGDHWGRVKAIVTNMKSLFIQMYGDEQSESQEIIGMIDTVMEIGEKINLVQRIENTFDHDLLDFLRQKWEGFQAQILDSSPYLKTILSIDGKVLLLALTRGLVKQFGHFFRDQALAHIKEQDFVIETMRTSGFLDKEIFEVFDLLGLPIETLVNSSKTLISEARSLDSYSDQLIRRNGGGGYGHSDGGYGGAGHQSGGYGGGGGGYGGGYEVMKKDPYLLLAALAFAACACFLLFKLLSSTPAIGKRSLPDISLSLTLSDMPETISKLYSWLEKTNGLYGDPDQAAEPSQEESFSKSLNELWESFDVDRLSKACVRRYLCHHVESNTFKLLESNTNMEQLALLGVAELMGEEDVGRMMDKYITSLMDGRSISCKTGSPDCDETAFESVINKRKTIK